jgi:ankyrin repeat protein
LHLAVFLVNEDIADLLLKSGRFFAVQLTYILAKYCSNVVALMSGLWKELPDALKEEIAFRASACGHVPMLRFINDQGFNMNIKSNKDEKNLLQVAADEGKPHPVLKSKSATRAPEQFLMAQYTLFIHQLRDANAMRVGQYDACLYLLVHSTFEDPPKYFVNDTLFRIVRHIPQTAADMGKQSTLLKLLSKSGNVLVGNTRGETVLHEAAFHGNLAVTEFLLQMGARIDVKTK